MKGRLKTAAQSKAASTLQVQISAAYPIPNSEENSAPDAAAHKTHNLLASQLSEMLW